MLAQLFAMAHPPLWNVSALNAMQESAILDSLSHNSNGVVGRLPYELWRKIFELSLEEGQTGPLQALTATCHNWREIALDCASLWTNVFYRYRGDYHDGLGILQSIASLVPLVSYLMRSKQALLSIGIAIYPSPLGPSSPPVLCTLFELLYLHRARWFTLSVTVDRDGQDRFDVGLFLPFHGPFPELRHMDIMIGDGESEEPHSSRLLEGSPECQLESLALVIADSLVDVHISTVDISRLETLVVAVINTTGMEILELIARCTQLNFLGILALICDGQDAIISESLHWLRIYSVHQDLAVHLIHAPNLRHLNVEEFLDEMPDHLYTPFSHCYPNIQSFAVSGEASPVTISNFRAYLEGFPALLAIQSPLDDLVVTMLRTISPNMSICPLLRLIRLKLSRTSADSLFEDMIPSLNDVLVQRPDVRIEIQMAEPPGHDLVAVLHARIQIVQKFSAGLSRAAYTIAQEIESERDSPRPLHQQKLTNLFQV